MTTTNTKPLTNQNGFFSMMKFKNKQVVTNWLNGESGSNGHSLRTDGKELYSYELRIGTTYEYQSILNKTNKTLFRYTGDPLGINYWGSDKKLSSTTSTHVNLAYNTFIAKCHSALTSEEIKKLGQNLNSKVCLGYNPENAKRIDKFIDSELYESREFENVYFKHIHSLTENVERLDRKNRFGGITYGVLDAVGVA
tara:strand:- start:789 stop:1376 length:588 start_codon:yes stop_codon:yes gene_type:complete